VNNRPTTTGITAQPTRRAGLDINERELRIEQAAAAGPVRSWMNFWFAPIDAVGLHFVRIFTGMVLIFWLLSFAGYQDALFGLTGWFDAQAIKDTARLPGGAPVPFGWSILYLAGNETAVHAMYWGSIVILLAFTIGLFTRVTSVLSWVIVVSFTLNPAISFDADFLLVVFAFYLMVGYVLLGQWSRDLSIRDRILGSTDTLLRIPSANEQPGSRGANLAIRLLQVHFALAVCVSALHKLQYGYWWGGVALWFPMHPPLETTFEGVRMGPATRGVYLFTLSAVQYALMAWQLAFPLFAWKQWARPLLLAGGILGWIGSVFVFQLPLFGPIYLIGCLAFLTPAEWRTAFGWLGNLGGRFGSASTPQSQASRLHRATIANKQNALV